MRDPGYPNPPAPIPWRSAGSTAFVPYDFGDDDIDFDTDGIAEALAVPEEGGIKLVIPEAPKPMHYGKPGRKPLFDWESLPLATTPVPVMARRLGVSPHRVYQACYRLGINPPRTSRWKKGQDE